MNKYLELPFEINNYITRCCFYKITKLASCRLFRSCRLLRGRQATWLLSAPAGGTKYDRGFSMACDPFPTPTRPHPAPARYPSPPAPPPPQRPLPPSLTSSEIQEATSAAGVARGRTRGGLQRPGRERLRRWPPAARRRQLRNAEAGGVIVAREVDAVAVARDWGHDGGQSAAPSRALPRRWRRLPTGRIR